MNSANAYRVLTRVRDYGVFYGSSGERRPVSTRVNAKLFRVNTNAFGVENRSRPGNVPRFRGRKFSEPALLNDRRERVRVRLVSFVCPYGRRRRFDRTAEYPYPGPGERRKRRRDVVTVGTDRAPEHNSFV